MPSGRQTGDRNFFDGEGWRAGGNRRVGGLVEVAWKREKGKDGEGN